LATPSGRRDLLRTGPGPDRGGSKPVRKGCAHLPEKSGMDAALGGAVVAAGATDCPKAEVAVAPAAAANVTDKRKSCHRAPMISSPSWFAHPHAGCR
jgi:hypothetical protein